MTIINDNGNGNGTHGITADDAVDEVRRVITVDEFIDYVHALRGDLQEVILSGIVVIASDLRGVVNAIEAGDYRSALASLVSAHNGVDTVGPILAKLTLDEAVDPNQGPGVHDDEDDDEDAISAFISTLGQIVGTVNSGGNPFALGGLNDVLGGLFRVDANGDADPHS